MYKGIIEIKKEHKGTHKQKKLKRHIGVTGFEPATSCSQDMRATPALHPVTNNTYILSDLCCQEFFIVFRIYSFLKLLLTCKKIQLIIFLLHL